MSVWLSTEYVRAALAVPVSPSAAATTPPRSAQQQATAQGCDQVVWLDAIERRYIEEMGGMNLFFVFGSGSDARLVTPELSGSLLPGITCDSLLTLAADAGFGVEERKISTEELRRVPPPATSPRCSPVVPPPLSPPIGRVRGVGEDYTIADGRR